MRTFGIEEEFLVVDPASGRPLPLGDRIVDLGSQFAVESPCALTTELQSEQIESVSPIFHSLDEVERAIRIGRSRADELAQMVGARVIALGTSPIPVDLGLTAREQLTCGFHLHVAVESAEEGVGILDRIRSWLPVLLALSANSPYWNGHSTGYASYRRQVLSRLPSFGLRNHCNSLNFRCFVSVAEHTQTFAITE